MGVGGLAYASGVGLGGLWGGDRGFFFFLELLGGLFGLGLVFFGGGGHGVVWGLVGFGAGLHDLEDELLDGLAVLFEGAGDHVLDVGGGDFGCGLGEFVEDLFLHGDELAFGDVVEAAGDFAL